jgi:hypothetical protein
MMGRVPFGSAFQPFTQGVACMNYRYEIICPVCSVKKVMPVPRRWYMRLMSHTRYYCCFDCGSTFIVKLSKYFLQHSSKFQQETI